MSGPVFDPRSLLRRFTKVYGVVRGHKSLLNFSVSFNFRAAERNAERNSRLLLMALEELGCPFEITTHASQPRTKLVKRNDEGAMRERTVKSVRVTIAGGLWAASWIKAVMRGPCGHDQRDRLLRQAAIRAKQIEHLIRERHAATIKPAIETPEPSTPGIATALSCLPNVLVSGRVE